MVSLSSFVLAAESANHTFTDQQGRTMAAQIVRVAQPDVYLQSGAGQPFPVKIGVFVAKDQAFIEQWALGHQTAAEPFSIFAVRTTLNDSSQNLPEQGFSVTLKNFSGAAVTNLRVEYVVLRQPTQTSTGPLPRISGATTIASLANLGEVTFATDRIGAKGSRLAVWVRVYNASGVLLQEWSSSPVMTKQEQWNPAAANSSASGGAGQLGFGGSAASVLTRAQSEAAALSVRH